MSRASFSEYVFDPKVLTFEVAINAVYLLFKRAHYAEMKRLGMKNRETFVPILQQFDLERLSVGRLTKTETTKLVQVCPMVLDAAIRLIGVYMVLWSNKIKEHVKKHG